MPRALPLQAAKELILTGEPMSARRLEALGVVSKVVPAGQALGAAIALAEQIAANSPVAVSQALQAVDNIVAAGGGDDVGWQ